MKHIKIFLKGLPLPIYMVMVVFSADFTLTHHPELGTFWIVIGTSPFVSFFVTMFVFAAYAVGYLYNQFK